jgi:hypothetical protein
MRYYGVGWRAFAERQVEVTYCGQYACAASTANVLAPLALSPVR